MTQRERRLSVSQKRKLTMELAMLAITVMGVIILICNLFKIVPENNFVAATIAYGFLIGPVMFVLGIGSFLEIRNTKVNKFSKKAR